MKGGAKTHQVGGDRPRRSRAKAGCDGLSMAEPLCVLEPTPRGPGEQTPRPTPNAAERMPIFPEWPGAKTQQVANQRMCAPREIHGFRDIPGQHWSQHPEDRGSPPPADSECSGAYADSIRASPKKGPSLLSLETAPVEDTFLSATETPTKPGGCPRGCLTAQGGFSMTPARGWGTFSRFAAERMPICPDGTTPAPASGVLTGHKAAS